MKLKPETEAKLELEPELHGGRRRHHHRRRTHQRSAAPSVDVGQHVKLKPQVEAELESEPSFTSAVVAITIIAEFVKAPRLPPSASSSTAHASLAGDVAGGSSAKPVTSSVPGCFITIISYFPARRLGASYRVLPR